MATSRGVTVWYFYRVRWGHHGEFVDLFRKNHYPVLAEQVKSGRFLSVRCVEPKFHGDGRADWNFATEIVFRDVASVFESTEPEIKKRLYPDQEAFRREEQRRFELIEAHWDVPLKETDVGGT
ncbi:MAG: hypothetical protein AB1806_17610 [Acidobacteriota bacterium]